MSERILGYILLAIGIAVILFAAYSVFGVFTAKSKPVDLFSLSGISLDLSSLVGNDLPPEANQDGGSLNKELVSSELINIPLNIFAHLMLMGFVASVGFKLASLGVMLVRPIKVNLREAKSTS